MQYKYEIKAIVFVSFLVSYFVDICRVCRAEGTKEKPLYHPCICTGSIKYIHQEWLVCFVFCLQFLTWRNSRAQKWVSLNITV